MATDDPTGLDQRPIRYDVEGRETLDRIRDVLGEHGYIAGCLFNVLKYLDRRGKKGDAAEDEAKALFYLQAALNAVRPDKAPDPRHHRATFEPYKRRETGLPNALYDLTLKVERGDLLPFEVLEEVLLAVLSGREGRG